MFVVFVTYAYVFVYLYVRWGPLSGRGLITLGKAYYLDRVHCSGQGPYFFVVCGILKNT